MIDPLRAVGPTLEVAFTLDIEGDYHEQDLGLPELNDL